ncbi:MAG: FlgO family outer membrane protein [Thermodesulfobacteriota bacterium]
MLRRDLLWVCLLLLLLSACAGRVRTGGTVSVMAPDFFGISENIARQLELNHRQDLAEERLVMATLVQLDAVDDSSSFGRLMTEALATQLFRHGAEVVETRKLAELAIREDSGEFILSRRAGELAAQHQATAIVAGTYSLTPQTVVVNIRLLDVGSDRVLSVAGIEIQRSPAINRLLYAGGGTTTPTRLSVYEKEAS